MKRTLIYTGIICMAAFLSGCGNNGQTENGKTESKDLTTEPSASESLTLVKNCILRMDWRLQDWV